MKLLKMIKKYQQTKNKTLKSNVLLFLVVDVFIV